MYIYICQRVGKIFHNASLLLGIFLFIFCCQLLYTSRGAGAWKGPQQHVTAPALPRHCPGTAPAADHSSCTLRYTHIQTHTHVSHSC